MELGLDKTVVTDSGLRHLMGLKNLDFSCLDKTKITDDGLPRLYGLSRIEMITLIDTDTTQEGRAFKRRCLSATLFISMHRAFGERLRRRGYVLGVNVGRKRENSAISPLTVAGRTTP